MASFVYIKAKHLSFLAYLDMKLYGNEYDSFLVSCLQFECVLLDW